MPSERIQRRIDALLDQAEEAMDGGDWASVAEKNIVHRDFKPGNVWLTADGVAKIGDNIRLWRADIHNLMVALVPLLDRPSRVKVESMGWGSRSRPPSRRSAYLIEVASGAASLVLPSRWRRHARWEAAWTF